MIIELPTWVLLLMFGVLYTKGAVHMVISFRILDICSALSLAGLAVDLKS